MNHNLICILSMSCALTFLFPGCSEELAEKSGESPSATVKQEKPKQKKTVKHGLGKKRKAVLPAFDHTKRSFDKVNPKFVSRMAQSAIDKNDYSTLSAFAIRARNSKDPKVRAVVVEALGWFQQKAVPDLIQFINDEDPTVSSAAIRLVDVIIDAVDNDSVKADFVEKALPYTTDEMVDTIVSKLDTVDRSISFLKLMSLMDSYGDDSVVTDSLIRQYEFMSGEKFSSKQAAHRWFFKSQKEKGRTR